MKLWAGRFQKETDTLVNDFNSSIQFDARLYKQDIQGSIAHAAMLGQQGISEEHEVEQIVEGLKAILADIEADKVEFSVDNEDIHMNIETLLTQRIGDAGKRLHTARSRNDQVAVDTRLYVKEEIPVIISMILDLEQVLAEKAREHTDTVMPGYTHLQRAQPTTFGHYMMAYANMFKRDVTRLEDCLERLDECPLGAGALATTTYPVDRFQTAKALGFRKPTDNSMDSVSDRDYAIELLSALSILMMHLSRFSEEIILWCSWEFKFVDLDDAYSTGSSIMPQKKNPDVAELVRGKTGRVYGFPELLPGQRQRIRFSKRVANPGCHASGFLSIAAPLVKLGVLPPDYPVTCFSITGYSGGGKEMIAEFQDPGRDPALAAPSLYALGLDHSHLNEMQHIAGLDHPPVFTPILSDMYSGMSTSVPLQNRLLRGHPTAEDVCEMLASYYEGQALVTVAPFGKNGPRLVSNAFAGTDRLEITVCGHGEQTLLTARFDNLGKGVAAAAVQNLNLMLGFPETEGLDLSVPERP